MYEKLNVEKAEQMNAGMRKTKYTWRWWSKGLILQYTARFLSLNLGLNCHKCGLRLVNEDSVWYTIACDQSILT